MTVYQKPVLDFVSNMKQHWTTTLGQVLADGLTYNWKLFAETMENVVRDNHQGNNNAYVIPMATGESKTQGASMYCSLTNERALVIVYRTEDADLVASNINTLGGEAIAYHSKANVDIEATSAYRTLIITHEMFKRHGYRNSKQWKQLSDNRPLVIIDETLQDVTMTSIGEFELNILKNTMRNIGEQEFSEVVLTGIFEKTLKGIKGKEYRCFMPTDHNERKLIMIEDDIAIDVSFNLWVSTQAIIDKLNELPLTEPVCARARRNNQVSYEPVARAQDIEALTVIRDSLSNGCFGHSESRTINVIRQLLPDRLSYVVLDATADVNSLYETQKLHKGNLEIVPVKPVRNYNGVNIHTALTKTGKGSLSPDDIRSILSTVPIAENDEVLFVTHNANEAELIAYVTNLNLDFEWKYHIDHWGNLTGTNKYRHCNKAVLIGLPHKPSSIFHAINIYKASEPFAYSEDGNSNRNKLQFTDMAADIVQAIARIRLRNITDTNGGCLPSDIYITINPRKEIRDTLHNALIKKFPGTTITDDWNIPKELQSKRRETVLEATLAYVDNRLKDIAEDIPVLEPRQNLNLDKENYRKMLSRKTLNENLLKIGVEIQERYTKDKYGRAHKKPKKFYVRIAHRTEL